VQWELYCSGHGVDRPAQDTPSSSPGHIPFEQFLDGNGVFAMGVAGREQWMEDRINSLDSVLRAWSKSVPESWDATR
jgi:hypothetical protein